MDNTVGKYRAGANLAAFWLLIFVVAEYFTYSVNIAIKVISLLLALSHSVGCFIYIERINQERKVAGIKRKWLARILIGLILTITSIYALGFLMFTVIPAWLRGLILAFNHILLFRLPYFSLKKQKQKEAPEDA